MPAWLPCLLLLAGTLSSCQKTDGEMDDDGASRMSRQMKQDIEFISSIGYDVSDIEKADDGYLVEGDIWLTAEWLADAKQQRPETRLSKHTGGSLVVQQYQNKLCVDMSNFTVVSSLWTVPVVNAINQWNSLSKCYIDIINVTGGGRQELKITFKDKSSFGNNSQKLMKVTPPTSDGKPGSVMLNKDCAFLPNYDVLYSSPSKATYLIMHAIGHALGLGHTLRTGQVDSGDEDWGTAIGGTPAYDDRSIMVRETASLSWTGFSSTDKTYIPKVFPEPETSSLTAGSIEEKKTISQTSGTFSINSVTDAAKGAGTIRYAWEKRSGDNWAAVSGQTGKNLTNAPVPAALTSEYRRKATDGKATVYSNTCTVTNNKYDNLIVGRITDTVLLETLNPADQFTIYSEFPALCGDGSVRHEWEVRQGETWTTISGATDRSLTIPAPMAFATVYRRKAICKHGSKYSNECTVYNKPFMDAGAIEESVEMNKTAFDNGFCIRSLRDAPLPQPDYQWEVYQDNGWVDYTDYRATDASLEAWILHYSAKFRRRVSSPFGDAFTNECTVINYSFREDPLAGTDPSDHAVQMGPYNSDFERLEVFDTRGEHFQDLDMATLCGKDAFMDLILTCPMLVEFKTASPIMGVMLFVRREEPEPFEIYYSDRSSSPYSEFWNEFPSFEKEEEHAKIIALYLPAGKYSIQVEGTKAFNAGIVDQLIGLRIRGTVGPVPPLEPRPTGR